MIFAVTPNGDILTFRRANYMKRFDSHIRLYETVDAGFIADIPKTWAVSMTRPISECSRLRPSFDTVVRDVRQISGFDAAQLKKMFRDFNARTYNWK